MPVRHQRSSFVRRSGTRRKVIWATSQVSNTQLNPGVNITPIDVLAGLESGGVGIIGGTVVRAHVWTSFSAADTDASPSFIWGLSMWDKSSLGTSNPNVQTDFYADWLMLREISPGSAQNTTPAPINAPTEWLYGAEYDVKSRRRIREMHDTLVMCLGNQGTVAANYSWFIRTLVMLP